MFALDTSLIKNINLNAWLLFFLLAASPILFGAKQPFIHGLFTVIILTAAGIWVVNNMEELQPAFFKPINIPPAVLLVFIFFSSLSLPLFLVNLLSPARGGYLTQAMEIGQLAAPVKSISYFGAGTQLYAVSLAALFLFFFYSAHLLRTRSVLKTTLWIITVIGTLEALYGIVQAILPSVGVLWLPGVAAEGRASGTIINRSHYAAFLNLCWPVAATLGTILYKPVVDKLLFRKRMKSKLSPAEKINTVFQVATIPFWGCLFMLLAIILSGSAGGVIVMLLTMSLFLFFLPLSKKLRTLIAVILLFIISLYSAFADFQFSGIQISVLWLKSLGILKDHLIAGIGMGSYKFLSPIYIQQAAGLPTDSVHNDYLELVLELGAPMALLLAGWIFWGISRYSILLWKVKKESKAMADKIDIADNNFIASATFCSVMGYLMSGFADFTWRLPVNMIYAVTVLAILSATLSNLKEKR